MSFSYLDHEADVGVAGTGSTVEEAFEQGALAVLNLMADVRGVRETVEREIECQAPEPSTLFVELINDLLAERDIADLLFARITVARIEQIDVGYHLKARAYGEPIDPHRHELRTEVKAATYSGLQFEKIEGTYRVQCVVDV